VPPFAREGIAGRQRAAIVSRPTKDLMVGGSVGGTPLDAADQQAVAALSAQVLTAAFIANVASIVAR
jgi:hypothetical protein